MQITVRYFASLRESLGARETVELAPTTTVAAARRQLCESSSLHREALRPGRPLRAALNQVVVDNPEQVVIGEHAELAFFPPVTGG